MWIPFGATNIYRGHDLHVCDPKTAKHQHGYGSVVTDAKEQHHYGQQGHCGQRHECRGAETDEFTHGLEFDTQRHTDGEQ